MIRWPLLVIGVGLMASALIARFQQPPLSTEARLVTVAEAVALTGHSVKQFVELEARVDTDRRIYSTGNEVSRPVYTANPPDQVYPVRLSDSGDLELEKCMGNTVRVDAGVESRFLRLQTIRDRALEEKQVLQERLLAPVQGSGYRLWALSDAFAADAPEGTRWLNQTQLQGYLTRFKDVEANRSQPKFSHDLRRIYEVAEREFGQAVPDNAYLLLTDGKNLPGPVSYFYCPIRDSQDALFYELAPDTVTNVPTVLRGVLEPSPLDLYGDFEKALGTKVPARIGILRPMSAEGFNERRASNLREVALFGATLATLGLLGFLWKRIRGSRKPADPRRARTQNESRRSS